MLTDDLWEKDKMFKGDLSWERGQNVYEIICLAGKKRQIVHQHHRVRKLWIVFDTSNFTTKGQKKKKNEIDNYRWHYI